MGHTKNYRTLYASSRRLSRRPSARMRRQKRKEAQLAGTTHSSKTQEPIMFEMLPSYEEITIKVENLDNEIIDKIGEGRKEDDENFYGKVKEEEGAKANNDRLSHPENLSGSEKIKQEISLNQNETDTYWLPNRLNGICNEGLVSREKTAEVLEILKDAGDDAECENLLLLSLGHNGFDFIKQLIKLRHMIAFCTVLASSQSDSERQDIRDKINVDPRLFKILIQLDILKQLDKAEEAEENEKRKLAAQW